MKRRQKIGQQFLPPGLRITLAVVLALAGVGFLAGAAVVALKSYSAVATAHGESAALIVTIGKICGLLAGSLVLFQFVLSSRLKVLDRIFGLHGLFQSHRILGVSAVVLASLHPMLIFAPRSIMPPALSLSIWPIFVGAALLMGLWVGACLALWRKFLRLQYGAWRPFHCVGMFGAAAFFTIHASNVAHDFSSGWPRYALFTAVGLYAILFAAVILIKPWLKKRRKFQVESVSPAGKNTYAVELKPPGGRVFLYAPGQFAFVTFYSSSLPVERHPWTISSTPTRPQRLIFTIKCSGDFTNLIGHLKPGDRAVVEGPYGRFSHRAQAQDPQGELIMIAGGVGVTPMLSMLRYMTDNKENRKIMLIWSNKTEDDILCREELEDMLNNMESLTVRHVLTKQKDFAGLTGRLDAVMLKDILTGWNKNGEVFVCGPPPMMTAVCMALKQIGYKARRIHSERFSY